MAALQIKEVPSELHERARTRAEELDLTLGDYVLSLIRRDLERSQAREWRAQLLERPVVAIPEGLVVELIREGRGEDN
ncbi:MAG: hypothetical protein ACKOJH_11475 [Actinomycetota bacterium]